MFSLNIFEEITSTWGKSYIKALVIQN